MYTGVPGIMFQLEAITDLGFIVQVLSIPGDFQPGIYLCFPLILGNLKYKPTRDSALTFKGSAMTFFLFSSD